MPERTFGDVAGPAQMLMSVTLPFLGALLGADLLRSRAAKRGPTLLVAGLLAVAVGVFGALGPVPGRRELLKIRRKHH